VLKLQNEKHLNIEDTLKIFCTSLFFWYRKFFG